MKAAGKKMPAKMKKDMPMKKGMPMSKMPQDKMPMPMMKKGGMVKKMGKC